MLGLNGRPSMFVERPSRELDEDERESNLHGRLPHARETTDLGHEPNWQGCTRAMARRYDRYGRSMCM